MPIRTETIDIENEIQRIEEEREALAEEVAAMDADHPDRARKAQRGSELDTHLDALEWAQTAHEDDDVPQWDKDVDAITLAGLTGGEFGKLESDVLGDANGRDPGAVERVYKVRAGTETAPYLTDGMSESEEIAAIAGLPVSFLKYATSKIDDLSSVGNGERASFSDLLAEKKAEMEQDKDDGEEREE